MPRQIVYVVAADGEESLAEKLAAPLREAGYDVVHNGTVAIGESIVSEAVKALDGHVPIVLCGTERAVGNARTHKIVKASHVDGPPRLFVVQMEGDAYVAQLALRT